MNRKTDAITEGDSDAIGRYITDHGRVIHHWNQAAETLTGFAASEVIGRACYDNVLMHVDRMGKKLCTTLCPLAMAMLDGRPRESDIFLHHKQGHRVPVRVHAEPIYDEDGCIAGAREHFAPVVSRSMADNFKREEASAASVDASTGIPNRDYLEAELERDLFALRQQGYAFGVFLFRITNMAAMVERGGQQLGENLVRVAVNTIHASLRSVDVVGRWSDNCLLCLFPGADLNALLEIAELLQLLINNSTVEFNGESLPIEADFSGALAMETDTPASLIERTSSPKNATL